jgi:DNA-binding transcriptional ArsR family regulator
MSVDNFLKCIVDDNRKKIIMFLGKKEHSVTAIVKKLKLEQSLVSHHLNKLRCCGLVKTKQIGKNIVYSLADQEIYSILKKVELLSKKLKVKEECCK